MKGKKKGRAVWVNEEAREALRAYMATRPFAVDHEPLFLSAQGGPIDRRWAWRWMKNNFRRAGIYDDSVATHSLRKTFAQSIYNASGKDLYITQKALDHASPANTVKYLNSVDTDVKTLVLNRRIAS